MGTQYWTIKQAARFIEFGDPDHIPKGNTAMIWGIKALSELPEHLSSHEIPTIGRLGDNTDLAHIPSLFWHGARIDGLNEEAFPAKRSRSGSWHPATINSRKLKLATWRDIRIDAQAMRASCRAEQSPTHENDDTAAEKMRADALPHPNEITAKNSHILSDSERARGGSRARWNTALQSVVSDICQKISDSGSRCTIGNFEKWLEENAQPEEPYETGINDCDELYIEAEIIEWTDSTGNTENKIRLRSLERYIARHRSTIDNSA